MKYLLLLLLFSCRKENYIRDFKIKKGQHSSNTYVGLITKDYISVDVLFDESCKYDLQDEVQQHDINKLIGFSDCGSAHHVNSARFGWRWLQDSLQVFTYCYVDGVRDIRYIKSVNLDQWYSYQIINDKKRYIFILENDSLFVNKNCEGGIKYLLKPYFGGDLPAPHDINVQIKWK